MAKEKNQKKPVANDGIRENSALNKVAHRILALVDSNYEASNDLSVKNAKFQNIINREMHIANGVSDGSIIDFIQAQRESASNSSRGNSPGNLQMSKNLFTDNIDQIYNYLVELYDNKYMEMLDLKMVCKFIPALGQAVKITLDHITASDEVADTIKRSIVFDTEVDKNDQQTIKDEIERLETDHKLLKKLKNFTYKGALTCGASYIYSIPYSELFKLYADQKAKKEDRTQRRDMYKKATESAGDTRGIIEVPTEIALEKECIDVATESVTKLVESMPKDAFDKVEDRTNFMKESLSEVSDIIQSFDILDGCLPQSAMEAAGAYMAFGNMNKSDLVRSSRKRNDTSPIDHTTLIPDGAKDPAELKSNGSNEKFDKISNMGNYIKFIEARDLAPLKIFDETIGYYHIVEKKKKKKSGVRTSSFNTGGIFMSTMEQASARKEQAIDSIVDSISSMIMRRFNQDFLIENQNFKKTIADCIIAKGIVENDYSIQFIPAKYIYEFKIDENIDGSGESMLSESLFAGKMLLSFLVAKLLLFVNNSGDKTLVTAHKGPIDLYSKNQLDRAIRQLEGQNITFGDFLSPNIMFNKFNRNNNIVIPVSQNGTKLLEFEKLEGKQMNMDTEMEEKLEKMAIIGTSVPDSMMEYVNDLQFSRQVVTSNIKYAGFCSSIQADLEGPTTELYRDLLRNTSLSDTQKGLIDHVHFALPRPKVIINNNNAESMSTAKQIADMIAEMYYGADTAPEDAEAKRQFILDTMKEICTYFEWTEADARKERVDAATHGPKKSEESTDNFEE